MGENLDTPYVSPDVLAAQAGEQVEFGKEVPEDIPVVADEVEPVSNGNNIEALQED